VGNYHWVLDVAVNPFRMISVVTGASLGEYGDSLLYGFLHIGSLESNHRDCTIPACQKIPIDSPMHVSEMIFLLNCMSRFGDLKIHGLLETFEPIQSIEYLLAMGCSGPFGCVFTDNNSQSAHVFWKSVPNSYFPQLKTTKNTLPIQADGYNCGVYVIFSIQDMVITQRNREWLVADVFTTKTKDKKEAWKMVIKEKKPMVIPASYKIGTCFVKSPSKAKGADCRRLCDYMQMEFAILMECLHCIYIEAYSKRDCRTKWWTFGVPRASYIQWLYSRTH
jgi:hypothetical protein